MSDYPTEWNKAVANALLAPFDPAEVEVKQGFAYVEARTVQTRLDEVVGPGGWSFEWQPITVNEEHVVLKGTLTLLGVTKEDAGEAHINPRRSEKEELVKAAVSDALKRAAVHHGVGRLLYSLPKLEGRPSAHGLLQAARKAGYQPATGATPVRDLTCKAPGCGVILEPEAAEESVRQFGKVICHAHQQEWTTTRSENAPLTAPDARTARPAAAAQDSPSGTAETPDSALCSTCGTALTPGQVRVSEKAFGARLCPRHQREEQAKRIPAHPAA